MIYANKLTKNFGDKKVVRGINIDVKQGEIYGFLGTNGAGKTTTIKMLTGMIPATSGDIGIMGMDFGKNEIEIKKNIGVIPEEPKIYSYFTGHEFINFIMDVFKSNDSSTRSYFNELCEAFNIDYLGTEVGEMSHGMKQKLMLSSVLMRKPRVVFMDEPTVGLDAKSAKILKELLGKMSQNGSTIFLTTHVLEIAEKMCTRISILNKGEIIADGTLEELRKLSSEKGTSSTGHESLEDLFLKLTGQDEEVISIVREL